jgi:hypothetical protein
VDALAVAVMPWDAKPNRWHEGSAGWMALFPITAPVLVGYGLARLSVAMPARVVELAWRCGRVLGDHLASAWHAVRSLIVRTRHAVRAKLHDAMRAVRRTADTTVRRVRAALARLGRG